MVCLEWTPRLERAFRKLQNTTKHGAPPLINEEDQQTRSEVDTLLGTQALECVEMDLIRRVSVLLRKYNSSSIDDKGAGEASEDWIHVMVQGSGVYIPKAAPKERNPELDRLMEGFKAQVAEKEYQRMVSSIDPNASSSLASNLRQDLKDLKDVKAHTIGIINVLYTGGAVFTAVFLISAHFTQDLGMRILLSFLAFVLIVACEAYLSIPQRVLETGSIVSVQCLETPQDSTSKNAIVGARIAPCNMNLYSHSGYRHDRDRSMLAMDYSATPPGSLRNMVSMNNWSQDNRDDRRASTYSGAGAGHVEGWNESTNGASGFYRSTSTVDKTKGRGAASWSGNAQGAPPRDPDSSAYSTMAYSQGRGQVHGRRPDQPQHYNSDTARSEDGTERSKGFADRSVGTTHTVTYVKTFCEMATQTTEDDMGGNPSTWNGICVMSVDGKHQNRPAQQYQNQQQQQQQLQHQQQRPGHQHHPQQHVQQQQQQQRVQQPLRVGATFIPASRSSEPPSASVSKSLLNALTEPHSLSPSSATQPTSNLQAPGRASALKDSWGSPPSSANNASSAWDNSEETATHSPETSNWGTPGNAGADGWGSSATTETNNWSNNQTTTTASEASDPWMTPVSSVAPTAESASGGGGAASGWGETTGQKGVGALVDWSTGLVAEFPAEAKPTLMPITEKWNSRSDHAYDSRNSKTAPRVILQRPSQPRKPPQVQPPHPRQQAQSEDKQTASTATVAMPAAMDPWLTDAGTTGGSNWGDPPSTTDSTGSFSEKYAGDRDDFHSRRSSLQKPPGATGAVRRQQDADEQDLGHHPSSQGQERRPLTSEERFMKSLSRVGGGDRQESYYNGSSNSSHHSSQGDRSGYQNSGGSQDGDSGRGPGSNWNGYKSGTAAGYSRPSNQGPGSYQPTSFTASSPSNLTGRRYFNANPDRESATAAWSAAAAASQSSAGRATAAGSRNERSEPPNSSTAATTPAETLEDSGNIQTSRSATGKSKAAIGGLMTSNDMKSFLMAAKAFEPVSSKASPRGRRTSYTGSCSRNTSPVGSRNSSVSRQQHQLLEEHNNEEQMDASQDTPHQPEQMQFQSAETSKALNPHGSEATNWGTGEIIATARGEVTDWACEVEEEGQDPSRSEQDDTQHVEAKEDDGAIVEVEKKSEEIRESGMQSPPRSSGERTSAQAMEDNLLSFQTQKRDVSSPMAPESADAPLLDNSELTPQATTAVSVDEAHGHSGVEGSDITAEVTTDVSHSPAE
ncbi:hypothetical protein KVV02_003575 [Mortierella alpina]|uniref:Uncharacterized protein n=1 Tax=Mortierella alpina TaxID=64518 RepID=A0A9P8A6C9_MORAP|nr:hypothetical protein KVV02_003575 [Mortierella alpina]